MRLKNLDIIKSLGELEALPDGKLMINTINTYSYVRARKDSRFASALEGSGALIPDGMGIVWACRLIRAKCRPSQRVTGWDLFEYEMKRLDRKGGTCFFMGSSPQVLDLIVNKAAEIYPNIKVSTYSPPYKDCLDDDDNAVIIDRINRVKPDLLWIGMSAPKQEKWLAENWGKLDIRGHAGSIGAVFSFFAGTEKRAPERWQRSGFEWLYRFAHNPSRLWRRYITGNLQFAAYLIGEMFSRSAKS